jgi:hypothetical protein
MQVGIGYAVVALASGECAHLLKADVDGLGELLDGLVVAIGGRKEHDEEGEQQSDEVRIGDQPAIVSGRFIGWALSPWSHPAATFCGPRRADDAI